MKDQTKVYIAGLAIVVVIALVVLVSHLSHLNQNVGAVTPTVTTNLPSEGFNTVVVGNGCGYQSGIACTANIILNSYGVTQGGYELLNATGTAYQLANTDIQNYATVGFIATTSTTVTLPPFSAMSSSTFLANVGDREDYEFINASSTGGAITFAGSTGFYLQTDTASSTASKILTGSTTAFMIITRSAANSYTATLSIFH